MTTEKLISTLENLRDDPEINDDYNTADTDLHEIASAIADYDDDHSTNYYDRLLDGMDDKGIVDRDTALQNARTDKKQLEAEGETDDPQYTTDVDNINYLDDNDDMYFAGPLWHTESYGTFTGDRANYDAVHSEDVSDIADDLLNDIKGADY